MHAESSTDVIFIGGRSGVGKSSVAAEASLILARADIRHALIEGDNLDQAYPEPWRHGIDLAEQNLAAMWSNYRSAGYSRLIYTNTVSVLQITSLVAALGPDVRSFSVLLTATDATAPSVSLSARSGPRWKSTSPAATSPQRGSTVRAPYTGWPPIAARSMTSPARCSRRPVGCSAERIAVSAGLIMP